jgi:hypothetical protein
MREIKLYDSRLSMGIYSKQNMELIHSKDNQTSEIKILEWKELSGSSDLYHLLQIITH